jgi:hypothetical protein
MHLCSHFSVLEQKLVISGSSQYFTYTLHSISSMKKNLMEMDIL